MPKVISQTELDQLSDLISHHPEGIGIEAILQTLGSQVQRRSLQRRLAMLVERGQVQTTGTARATRYYCKPDANENTFTVYQPTIEPLAHEVNSPVSMDVDEIFVPISPEGLVIKHYVRQARQFRTPVGYRLEFLEQYTPNHSFYLPESLRTQLYGLGQSPQQHMPAGTFARDILNRLLIDLSWASSKLEGNTYSRLDTERLIEFGQAAEGKNATETQMILNHKDAIEYLVRFPESATLSKETVIALHAFLSNRLMPDPAACGQIRKRAVGISGSVYLPVELPQLLAELFGIVIQIAQEIIDPFEQAFFLMVHLPYLQPFEDVNKRVSRLAANIPFIRHNLCPLSFIHVPQQLYIDAMIGVYELHRTELLRDVFVWAYERSCQQYVAVKQNLVQPTIFQLRYRQELSAVVSHIIRNNVPPAHAAIKARVPASVTSQDRDPFVEMVKAEFKSLHEGNAIRFGIRPLEYLSWLDSSQGQNLSH